MIYTTDSCIVRSLKFIVGTCNALPTDNCHLALLHRSASRCTRVIQTEEATRGDMTQAYVFACKFGSSRQMNCFYGGWIRAYVFVMLGWRVFFGHKNGHCL